MKTVLIWLIISLACGLFSYVYERYSHGVYSWYMVWLFLFPLIGGAVPALIIRYTGLPEPAGNIVSLWRCGIATLTTGSCLQGIFEIYGSAASLVQIYWIAGFSLLAASGILCLIHFQSDKRKNHSVHDRMKTDI